MKILRIIPSMNPKLGGPCQGIRNSIPALQKLGIENSVVCMDDPEEEFLKKEVFTIYPLGRSKKWAYHPGLIPWLEKNAMEYDVVIIHGLWLYHSYAAIKVFEKMRRLGRRLRVYVMPHGMLDPWFQRDKSRKLKAIRNEIYWRLIEKNVVNSADGLLFTCEQELLLARETFKKYRPKKELNVGYGVQPPPEYDKETMPFVSDRPYLLFLSRIHPKKGIDLLINAYLKQRSEGMDLPDLVIAGPKESTYAKEMMLLAANDPHIHFTGLLQGDQKWGAFYGAEAFILPSHQENFGIAVVEALACGIPVLITDKVNIWREIQLSGAGIIQEDTHEGVNEMLTVWNAMDQDKKSVMAEAAKQAYRNYYSSEQAAQKMLDAIKQTTDLKS